MALITSDCVNGPDHLGLRRIRGVIRARKGISMADRAAAEQLATHGHCPLCTRELGPC